MSSLTTDNMAVAIVRLVAARALPVLESNLFMARLVNRNYEPVLAQAGASVDIPIAPSLTANNIAETGQVQTQNPSLGNATVTLTSHIESSFFIPDVAKALSNIDLVDTFMQPAMLTLAERVEGDLLGLYPLFTFNASVGAANTAPTEQVVDDIDTTFFKSKIPTTAPKYCACSADFYASLRQIPRFSEENKIGSGDAIISGEFGKLKNVAFFRSQIVTAVSSTTSNLAFTSDAIALVTRKLDTPLPGTGAVATYAEYGNVGMRVTMSYAPNTLGHQFTVDILYGCGAVRNQAGIVVLS